MVAPTRPQTDRLLELIGEVSGLADLASFRSALVSALGRAVPSKYVSYNEVDGARSWGLSEPPLDVEAFARWHELAAEHPLLVHQQRTRDGRPSRISDHVASAAFRATALYREFYASLGIESQLAFGLPAAPPLVIGIALSRGAEDFRDDELELLGRARPHLIQAYRSAQAAEERERVLRALARGLEATGRLAVAVSRDGAVLHASAHARDALGVGEGRGARLDDALRLRMEHDRAAAALGSLPLPTGAGTVRVLPGPGEDDLDVLLVEPPDRGMTVTALGGLGLTPREAETLRWLALGRSSVDVAAAMGVAPRTVAKHLQAVYAKLGVASRAEAVLTAWAAVDAPPVGPAG